MAEDREVGKGRCNVLSAARTQVPSADEAPSAGPVPDDHELVRRAQKGDRQAMERLLASHYPRVLATAFRLCDFDLPRAQETAQEAMIQVLRHIGRFQGRSAFSTWLHRIVVNTCLMERRKRKRRLSLWDGWRSSRGEDPPSRDGVGSGVPWMGTWPAWARGQPGLRNDVQQALRLLSERQRTVFILKVFEEMTLKEISEATGMALGTVKTHLVRAMQAMRRHLQDYDGNHEGH
ncbi:RNA polymerase sigma-70 factor, ECF subfamily [Desulfacinum hydrothermale DSM 13146]|uniref:RNA polymerase sigma-70 factor, ECF subfamily n=1 Tax=Desulfacinum hydrothermale DSM 13146 TaxID=1121390 RepID=A0A1W1XG42_9BACT|nr:RNA polymerase sigma factor [Desulfacinum hydrothermale]SMC22945.1 RNA polymerase sigma-70 factor, ECF subfamily [Desulfacinum hydrothermale DSM 13146]